MKQTWGTSHICNQSLRKEVGTEKVFEEKMAETFSELMETQQIQEI